MGSLVGGWNSPMSDPGKVKLQRNKSMTNERIEAFWRLKKKAEKEHMEAMLDKKKNMTGVPELVVVPEVVPGVPEEEVVVLQRSASHPGERVQRSLKGDHQVLTKSGWWRRSSSAFLNQPPIIKQ